MTKADLLRALSELIRSIAAASALLLITVFVLFSKDSLTQVLCRATPALGLSRAFFGFERRAGRKADECLISVNSGQPPEAPGR